MEAPEVMDEQESAVTLVKAGTSYEGENGEKVKLNAGVEFNIGSDLTEACDLYGEEAVFQRYQRGVTKDLGNAIRAALNRELDNGTDPSEIPGIVEAELADWRPDVTRRAATKKDPTQAILSNFADLSPERQAEILAQLQAAATG